MIRRRREQRKTILQKYNKEPIADKTESIPAPQVSSPPKLQDSDDVTVTKSPSPPTATKTENESVINDMFWEGDDVIVGTTATNVINNNNNYYLFIYLFIYLFSESQRRFSECLR